MSYPVSLDEYSDEQLTEELTRRLRTRGQGKCSYCQRGRWWSKCSNSQHERTAEELILAIWSIRE